jgi:hypothetical protein
MSPATIEILIGLCMLSAAAGAVRARMPTRPREPVEGQRGKDIVWVGTPPELVEKMLDMAGVTAADRVMDLGSGDGRIVIAAAKRGARASGVEYDAALIEVAQRNASRAGVAERATFLLPDNLRQLTPKFAALLPGTRIVTNRFGIPGWTPDTTCRIGGDSDDCPTAVLYTVR